MAGIDKEGRALKRDQLPQSLQARRKRVCGVAIFTARKGARLCRLSGFRRPAVPLLTSSPVPTYDADIKPILRARCASCHATGAEALPLFDYDNLVWDFFQKSVPEGKRGRPAQTTPGTTKKYGLQRPYTSKYVHTSLPAKACCTGKPRISARTDGRMQRTQTILISDRTTKPT